MRKGSLALKRGSRVKRGDRLGEVGYSGLVEFAHLHFMVRHAGKVIDPESGLRIGQPCLEGTGADVPGSLWDAAARDAKALFLMRASSTCAKVIISHSPCAAPPRSS